ncbi:MAG: hypothetical protein HFJ53_02585 [Clostridia bacterium]|nr:hypothetical protein [Clostridia bacterium]
MKNKSKNIKIEKGNGKNLNISPVHEHLSIAKPKIKDYKNKNIIIPKGK